MNRKKIDGMRFKRKFGMERQQKNDDNDDLRLERIAKIVKSSRKLVAARHLSLLRHCVTVAR